MKLSSDNEPLDGKYCGGEPPEDDMSPIFDPNYNPFSVKIEKLEAKVKKHTVTGRNSFYLDLEFSDGEYGFVDLTKHLVNHHERLSQWDCMKLRWEFEILYLGTNGRAVIWDDETDFAASFLYEEMFRQRYSASYQRIRVINDRIAVQTAFDETQSEIYRYEKELSEAKRKLDAARQHLYRCDEKLKNADRNEKCFKLDYEAATLINKPSTMEEAREILREAGVVSHIDSSNYMFLWDMFAAKEK
jgi:hypothetical protein